MVEGARERRRFVRSERQDVLEEGGQGKLMVMAPARPASSGSGSSNAGDDVAHVLPAAAGGLAAGPAGVLRQAGGVGVEAEAEDVGVGGGEAVGEGAVAAADIHEDVIVGGGEAIEGGSADLLGLRPAKHAHGVSPAAIS